MASIAAFAGSVPENYDQYLGPVLFEPYALDLAERLGQNPVQNLLEIAAGTGRLSRHLTTHVSPGGRMVASDLNPDMLAVAKKLVPATNIEWKVADALNLPFENESFQLVVCQFGVMFFPDKRKAFSEIFRVLIPGGRFLFNVWDRMEFNSRALLIKDVMDEIMGKEAPDFFQKGPYSFFDIQEIISLLQEAGFIHIQYEIVKKTAYYPSPDHLINGFVDGSPLNSYLEGKDPSLKQLIKEKLREKLGFRFGERGVENQMQAIIFDAFKTTDRN